MRPQAEAILEAVLGAKKDGAFQMQAPFLSQAETIRAVNVVTAFLGGRYLVQGSELTPTVLKNWLNRGLFRPHRETPGIRNRLYSTADVIKLVAMLQAVQFGLPLHIASDIAEKLPELVADPDWDGDLNSESHRLVAVRMVKDGYHITLPDFKKTANPLVVHEFLKKHNVGMALFFDWKLITSAAIAECRDRRWRDKANRLRDEIEAELAKRKQGKRGRKPAERHEQ